MAREEGREGGKDGEREKGWVGGREGGGGGGVRERERTRTILPAKSCCLRPPVSNLLRGAIYSEMTQARGAIFSYWRSKYSFWLCPALDPKGDGQSEEEREVTRPPTVSLQTEGWKAWPTEHGFWRAGLTAKVTAVQGWAPGKDSGPQPWGEGQQEKSWIRNAIIGTFVTWWWRAIKLWW